MPRRKKVQQVVMTGKTMMASTIVKKLQVLVKKAGPGQTAETMMSNPEYARLIGILHANPCKATVIYGVPYAIGGIDAGRPNPKATWGKKPKSWRNLTQRALVGIADHASITVELDDTVGKCLACGATVGYAYKRTTAAGNAESTLNVSHGIPAVYGGSTNVLNCTVQCALCNKKQGTSIPRAVMKWLSSVRFKC